LKGEIVIDMICFTRESAVHLVEALSGHIAHFLHTGTIWTHGVAAVVPTPEEAPKKPFGEYGLQKAAIETYLLEKARMERFPATVIHPGHIVGPGWNPLNPAGHFNPAVFSTLARGETLVLSNFGLETVHHVHADDVAGLFMSAIANWNASIGESFHAVSEKALTLRGYAEAMAAWFGREPKLQFLPYDRWAESQDPDEASATWEHIARSPNCSMESQTPARLHTALHLTPGRARSGRVVGRQRAGQTLNWRIRWGQVRGMACSHPSSSGLVTEAREQFSVVTWCGLPRCGFCDERCRPMAIGG
jgi:nucleoside-diphosphate-sugar epimerase